jgi:hypothetical protein
MPKLTIEHNGAQMRKVQTIPVILVYCSRSRRARKRNKVRTGKRTHSRVAHQHDFDWEIGDWKVHLRRLPHPLAGSNEWVEYEGTAHVRKVWNGRANLLELELNGPAGHIEGLSLRLYNPQSARWSVYFATSDDGTLGTPMVGQFQNGRGEFSDRELFHGNMIDLHFVFSNVTEKSFHGEQSFSPDGGKSWETNWIEDFRRAGP